MGETRPGGMFRGTDGKLHDAHGNPVKETVIEKKPVAKKKPAVKKARKKAKAKG